MLFLRALKPRLFDALLRIRAPNSIPLGDRLDHFVGLCEKKDKKIRKFNYFLIFFFNLK